MLLIVTDRQDLSADYVILRLLEKRIPYFRLNSEELGSSEYCVELAGEQEPFSKLSSEGRVLDFSEVESVWYRRRPSPTPVREIPAQERQFASGELRDLIDGLLPGPECRWVDYPTNVWRAERKLRQLSVARQLGFTIPATLVSTDLSARRDFVSKHTDVVCKPIYRSLLVSEGSAHVAYTRRVTDQDLSNSEAGSFPLLLQQLIPRDHDRRVTFVGDQAFGVEIRSPPDAIDWRRPGVPLEYRIFEVGSQLEQRSRALLRHFGLNFGAFDFIRTPSGEDVFLEVNPVGEWAWLDRELGLDIREALIELLLGR